MPESIHKIKENDKAVAGSTDQDKQQDKYQECPECGSTKAGVFRANMSSCLVAECLNCGETIDSLQAGPEMIKR